MNQQQQIGVPSSSSSYVSPPHIQQLSPNSGVKPETIVQQKQQQISQPQYQMSQYRQSPAAIQKQHLQHHHQQQQHHQTHVAAIASMPSSSTQTKHVISSPTFIQSTNIQSPAAAASSLSPDLLMCGDSNDGTAAAAGAPLSPGRRFVARDTQRRAGHIHAEQKRRYNIKNGFDTLHSLIPQLQANPNAKLSKAAMLQKGAEYIRQLQSERTINNEKMEVLKRERDTLNTSLKYDECWFLCFVKIHLFLKLFSVICIQYCRQMVRQYLDKKVVGSKNCTQNMFVIEHWKIGNFGL